MASGNIRVEIRGDLDPLLAQLRHVTREMNSAVRAESMRRGVAREREARALILASLPRGLRWMVNHVRLLRVYYRLRPGKRPDLTYRAY